MKRQNLISINEAAKMGIERLRNPKWAIPEDHLKIDIIDGSPGPWAHLYAPFNLECNGRDPMDMMGMDYTAKEWLPYGGDLPDSEEYRAVQAKFNGVLEQRKQN